MKKIIILIAAACCISACHKATDPEPASVAEASVTETPAADSNICKRTPLAEFSPAPAGTDGSFTHLKDYLKQVGNCFSEQRTCDAYVRCLSEISDDTLLAAADDIQRDAQIVRDMDMSNIDEMMELVHQAILPAYYGGVCDEALLKFESIDEKVIHAGYHEASLFTSFFPYLIHAAQQNDCEAIRAELHALPDCIYANANIDFNTLSNDRMMGIVGLNYQEMHYNYVIMRLTKECGMFNEIIITETGISADKVAWDKSTGIIPEFGSNPMRKYREILDSNNSESVEEEVEPIGCKRKPLKMIEAKPGSKNADYYSLPGFHADVLNCMLTSCNEAVECIRTISPKQITQITEELKSAAYVEYDEDKVQDVINLFINPLSAIYQMSPCNEALEAFEDINLKIIKSYGYAESTYLSDYFSEIIKASTLSDCDKAIEQLMDTISPCMLGNAYLDIEQASKRNIGIPAFAYQLQSYAFTIRRLIEKSGCDMSTIITLSFTK